MQGDVFRGLRGWRQAALPSDMGETERFEPSLLPLPAALHKEKTLDQREKLPQ